MINVQNIHFRYDPEQPSYAVDGVSLAIHRGEFVAVLGANGCGKSTLAKHFNAILLPEAGTVLVEGMDTRNEDHLYDVRQKVGMVFQNPDNQIVATIVEEDVAFAPENLGVPPEEIRTRIDEAMKLAGIYEKRDAAPYKLSGGQKQRVAIAGVIAMRPDCLVLDESTAMLDPHGRSQVMKTIRQLREAGITIVSITHYMEEAANAGYVVILDKGSVAAEGTPFELKNDYVQDIVSVYGVSEDEIKSLNREYKKIRDGYQIKVKNTKEATELIVEHQDLFTDYEVVKGGMDDVFLAVTGKKLGGEH